MGRFVHNFVRVGLLGIVLAAVCVFGHLPTALAVEFRDFGPVEDTCPKCEHPPIDEVVFDSGRTVKAHVVAENESFYVLERFGEVRAAPKTSVRKINWKDGAAPAGLRDSDQVVLKNGHVLNGRVRKVKGGNYYEVQLAERSREIAVFKSEIEAIYRKGEQISK